MGDINYRNVDGINIARDHESDDFINIIQDNFFKQIVNKPTRESSILDLVLMIRDNLVSNMEIGGKLGNSDHRKISFKIKWDIKIPPNQVQEPDFR